MRRIEIDPRIIKHLGRDLITSSEVAVVELVKNCIDARAKEICLRLYSNCFSRLTDRNPVFDHIPEKCKNMPLLVVEDDGCGMTDEVIDAGFLKVGTSIKSNDPEETLGEKGIGRLAAQRLGEALLVETSSANEDHTSYVFINWEDIIQGIKEVTSFEGPISKPHTCLWIFGVNLEDYIGNAAEFEQLSLDNSERPIQVNRDLKATLNFLISPFTLDKSAESKPAIRLFFDDNEVELSFPSDMLALAESIHSFRFCPNGNEFLRYTLDIKPWFVERVHRALVKPDGFKRLKRPHEYYADLVTKNSDRIHNVLSLVLEKDSIIALFYNALSDFYIGSSNRQKSETLDAFIEQKAISAIEELSKISPVVGSIYSFKQGAAIGEKIVIDSAHELNYTEKRYSLQELKCFLEDYNGIKLYRGNYRIGFLGNKESDWIKLQQFRTKGQQWYRFDLGNTVGYVSLYDPYQQNIQEISSRLDISKNEASEAFKLLINIVFNQLFYELNRKANSLIKVFLAEEGLLDESLSKRVKKNDIVLQEMIQRNKHMQKALTEISEHFSQAKKISGTDQISLSEKSYSLMAGTLKKIDADVKADASAQQVTATLLSDADAQLKAIEVESYNNYKLMANGLITETITHELHSLCKTGIVADVCEHFDFLKNYFIQGKSVRNYNLHVAPIQNSYYNISGNLKQVGNLYSFLETTFIKKGTYDEFVHQNIKGILADIEKNLQSTMKKAKVSIKCDSDELVWFVPKGVLLHVFYNLINNSLYWIDVRQKWAQSDPHYSFSGNDFIMIEEYGVDGIVVSDSGTGVSKSMEDILFEPLESGKPMSEGRGMGLYIVRKLMNSFGGEIELLEERNLLGNRYKFLLINNTSEEL